MKIRSKNLSPLLHVEPFYTLEFGQTTDLKYEGSNKRESTVLLRLQSKSCI